MTYADKLKDPRWQKRRLEIMERDGWKCQLCTDATSTLSVHHLRYVADTEPWDAEGGDLVTLCDRCHRRMGDFSDWCKTLPAVVIAAEMDPEEARAIIDGVLANDGSRHINPSALSALLGSQEGRLALDATAECWAAAHFIGWTEGSRHAKQDGAGAK